MGSTAAPPVRRGARDVLRAIAEGTSMTIAVVAVWLLAPAFVTMSRGESARAGQAVVDTFVRHPAVGLRDPFARFRTPASQSAWGAIGYYLSYYGADARPLDAAGEGAPQSLDQVRAALAEDLPSRVVPLRVDTFPRVATVVELRDGAFGVVTRPTGEGPAELFVPSSPAQTRALPLADLLASIRPEGVIADAIRCDAAGCRAGD
jgi:hypothetical protein